MASSGDWFPGSEPAQVIKIQNIRDKIANYKSALDLSDSDIDEITALCNTFLTAVTVRNEADAFSQAVTNWKTNIKNGTPVGTPAPAAPTFTGAVLPAGATIGVVPQIREWREKWMLADGFTDAVGEDLMLFAAEAAQIGEDQIAAEMKASPMSGYATQFVFSKQGMDAMRIEWRYAGTENWQNVDTFTSSPATHTVAPQTPGQPVSVEYRCRLIRKNQQVGQWSPTYTVYVTP